MIFRRSNVVEFEKKDSHRKAYLECEGEILGKERTQVVLRGM
ncbi:hypothetical protein AB3N59_16395 [Leptospira sp. WS92.C1]